MIRRLEMLYFATLLAGLLSTAGCDKHASPGPEVGEAQRLQDQQERAAMADRLKAAAIAQDKKQEPIANLQKQIDALDEQIRDARSKGKDWRTLEKAQEALETKKYELQRQ
jgi:TolA-binding protein